MIVRLFHRIARPSLIIGQAVLVLAALYLLFVLVGWVLPSVLETAAGNGVLMLITWTALPAGFFSLLVFVGLMILWWVYLLSGFDEYRLIGKAGAPWLLAGVVLIVIGLIVS